ncbi:MAG: GlsB/YeaQ/YmgE family stress response membrane protein [Nocardioides sp.]
MGSIIATLVGGTVIGLLGKFVAPGNRDNIPLWLTVICGIGGSLIGYVVYTTFGGDGSKGIDWTRWIVSIAVAAILVVVASVVTGRKKA